MQLLLQLTPLCDIHADDQLALGQSFGVEQGSTAHEHRLQGAIFAHNDRFLTIHQVWSLIGKQAWSENRGTEPVWL